MTESLATPQEATPMTDAELIKAIITAMEQDGEVATDNECMDAVAQLIEASGRHIFTGYDWGRYPSWNPVTDVDLGESVHHFIVTYTPATKRWNWDVEAESGAFPNGGVYLPDSDRWVNSSHTEHIRDLDELASEQLGASIKIMNENPKED